jgi:hypothetical protein
MYLSFQYVHEIKTAMYLPGLHLAASPSLVCSLYMLNTVRRDQYRLCREEDFILPEAVPA